MNPSQIKEIVHNHEYMWKSKKDDFILIRIEDRFQIYQISTKEIFTFEVEEVSQKICSSMVAADVMIMDKLPNLAMRNLMAIWKRLKQSLIHTK